MDPVIHLEAETLKNTYYRLARFTTKKSQLVLMCITEADGGIPEEMHPTTEQFIRIEQGQVEIRIDGESRLMRAGDGFFIPPGARHEVIRRSSTEDVKLYTIYTPPQHRPDAREIRRAR